MADFAKGTGSQKVLTERLEAATKSIAAAARETALRASGLRPLRADLYPPVRARSPECLCTIEGERAPVRAMSNPRSDPRIAPGHLAVAGGPPARPTDSPHRLADNHGGKNWFRNALTDSGSHVLMTRKVLDGTQSATKLVTRRQKRIGTLADAQAPSDPLRDERSSGDAIDIERPENGHERPKEQFSLLHPALNQGWDLVASKPALDGGSDRSGKRRGTEKALA